MADLREQLITEAKKLLTEGQVKCLIGYRLAREPYRTTPIIIQRPEEAERLVWNSACVNNLARYLIEAPHPAAIMAKGCDSRSIVELIQEHKLERDQVYVLGMPCRGMVDFSKVKAGNPFQWTKIEGLEPEAEELVIRAGDEIYRHPKSEVLFNHCQVCHYPNPVIYDLMLGEEVPARSVEDEYRRVQELEALPDDERRAYWLRQFERCIRCHACRNICPACYCPECILDRMNPRIVHAAHSPEENLLYQIARAWHLAGRCVDCGQCERACPMNLPLRELNRKLEKEVRSLFGYEAGADAEALPLFTTFSEQDGQKEEK